MAFKQRGRLKQERPQTHKNGSPTSQEGSKHIGVVLKNILKVSEVMEDILQCTRKGLDVSNMFLKVLKSQEDHGLKPARANSVPNPISKTLLKKWLAEWLKVKALSANPSTAINK
jgi:hypothetical protein